MRSRLQFFAVAIALLLGSGQTARSLPRRTLSLAERVAYQYAIEEVYWHHRIWPKENPRPKPPLDEVMSRAQIERKVEDYLRNSQALVDHWQSPITPEQLQAELDRMASHTKQPDVLREIFAALGNEPFVIAECLARPILVERLLAELNDRRFRGDPKQPGESGAGAQILMTMAVSASYTLPVIAGPSGACTDDSWAATSLTNAPTGRIDHTAVWTGTEMIVWGGYFYDGNNHYLNTGARYNPSTDTWTPTSITNAPAARELHTAVWTGNEMIIWGGQGPNRLNSGGRYNPATNSWTATTTTNAPGPRFVYTAVWTGNEMIIWGGAYQYTGGRYNPSTDTWTPTSTANAPIGRQRHTAVWTDSEMIVWGGETKSGITNTGGRYNPSTDSWTATSATNAPAAREQHTAVWTGAVMIVWGGDNGNSSFNTGGRYNPSTDSWTATTIINAPTGRVEHAVVWTGSDMIVWGGGDFNTDSNMGGRYNPSTDSWIATSIINAPTARYLPTGVWTGNEMIVWGGISYDNGEQYFNTGGRYCAQPGPPGPTTLTITKTADAVSVSDGSQIGFVVNLMNTGEATAVGLNVADNLPGGPGINWTIDSPGIVGLTQGA